MPSISNARAALQH